MHYSSTPQNRHKLDLATHSLGLLCVDGAGLSINRLRDLQCFKL